MVSTGSAKSYATFPPFVGLDPTMSQANPLWGASWIHGELLKLDIHLSQATVCKYMIRNRKPHHNHGRPFSITTRLTWAPLMFLLFPPQRFVSSTYSSCCPISGGQCYISRLRSIPRLNGPLHDLHGRIRMWSGSSDQYVGNASTISSL